MITKALESEACAEQAVLYRNNVFYDTSFFFLHAFLDSSRVVVDFRLGAVMTNKKSQFKARFLFLTGVKFTIEKVDQTFVFQNTRPHYFIRLCGVRINRFRLVRKILFSVSSVNHVIQTEQNSAIERSIWC